LSPYFYYLKNESVEDETSTDIWAGAAFTKGFGDYGLNGFVLYNSGSTEYCETEDAFVDTPDDIDNSGFAIHLEGTRSVESYDAGILALYSTGEEDATATDRGDFHVILGPNYANYLEIFFPGAEDVAGVNVDLNNGDLGLLSVQGRVRFKPTERVWLSVSGGILQSAAENANGEKQMGTEVDGVIGYRFIGGLTTELGVAYALAGDFYMDETGNPDPDDMFEVYARLQFGF
jgi:hypothetical protein